MTRWFVFISVYLRCTQSSCLQKWCRLFYQLLFIYLSVYTLSRFYVKQLPTPLSNDTTDSTCTCSARRCSAWPRPLTHRVHAALDDAGRGLQSRQVLRNELSQLVLVVRLIRADVTTVGIHFLSVVHAHLSHDNAHHLMMHWMIGQ